MSAILGKFFRQWVVWLYSAIIAAIAGIAHTIAPMVIDPVAFNVHDGFKNVLHAAEVSFILGLVTFLMKSPLPSLPEEYVEELNVTKTTNIQVSSTPPKSE